MQWFCVILNGPDFPRHSGITKALVMIIYTWEMTARQSCRYSGYGLFDPLDFLVLDIHIKKTGS